MVTLGDVHAAFGAWLAFPEHDERRYELVDVALATVIANRMPGDPLWVFLVAPPSGGKTEVIRSLADVPDVFALSSLTAQTFASGFERKGVESSLLPRLSDKTCTMKDFGTILTMYREKRAEILAQLREIYDGAYTKEFGNGKSFKWEGKVGLLAGVTPIIDREYALNQVLGERFLLYRVRNAPARQLARRAIAQTATYQEQQRQTLREIVATFLGEILPVAPPMPDSMMEAIAALAEFTAIARSPVLYDPRGGEIELIPAPEAPGRLAKQLVLLARALAVIRAEAEVTVDTYLTIFQIAQDSAPGQRRVMLECLLDPLATTPPTTTDVAESTGYPTSTARRYLQELAAVGFAARIPEGPGHPDRWRASDMLMDLLKDVKRPISEEGSTRCVRGSVVSE